MQLTAEDNVRLVDALHRFRGRFASAERISHVSGILTRIVGFVMEARGIRVSVGQRCFVESAKGRLMPAEVIGFDGGRSFLMVEGQADGLAAGARVIPAGDRKSTRLNSSHPSISYAV